VTRLGGGADRRGGTITVGSKNVPANIAFSWPKRILWSVVVDANQIEVDAQLVVLFLAEAD